MLYNLWNQYLFKVYFPEYMTTGAVRLISEGHAGNNTYGAGLVEVYNDMMSSWGTLCHTDMWNEQDADVLCRQIGFKSGAAAGSILSEIHSMNSV